MRMVMMLLMLFQSAPNVILVMGVELIGGFFVLCDGCDQLTHRPEDSEVIWGLLGIVLALDNVVQLEQVREEVVRAHQAVLVVVESHRSVFAAVPQVQAGLIAAIHETYALLLLQMVEIALLSKPIAIIHPII